MFRSIEMTNVVLIDIIKLTRAEQHIHTSTQVNTNHVYTETLDLSYKFVLLEIITLTQEK